MMTRRSDSFVLMLLMAVALMAGCGKGSLLPQLGEDGRGLPQALVLADSLMNSRPDSALAVLDGAEEEMAGEHQRQQWQLLRLNAINKLDTVFTAAHVVHAQTLADYFDSHGNRNERMLANYLLGRTFYDCGKLPNALEAFHAAAACADTAASDCDYHTLCLVHCQMAEIFHRHYQPRTAIAELAEAQRMAYKDKDTLMAIECYFDQSNEYERLGRLQHERLHLYGF